MHDYYRQCLFLFGILPLLSISIVSAIESTQHWKLEYHPLNLGHSLLENRSSFLHDNYGCASILGMHSRVQSNNTVASYSIGASFRYNTAPSQIQGIYLIADNITADSKNLPVLNLGFEKSHHLLHHILNFYVPWVTLNDITEIHGAFPFKFGMDYKNLQRVSLSFWRAFGIYSFYHEHQKWMGGIALELKYVFSKKFELRGKVTFDTNMQPSCDIGIAYLNLEHYNPTHFSIKSQLQSLPLERHLAPFEYFLPFFEDHIQAADSRDQINNLLQEQFSISITDLTNASPTERTQYHRILSRALHPDQNVGQPDQKQKEELLKITNAFFDRLK